MAQVVESLILSVRANAAFFVGGMLNGYLASKYGYRWVMIGALGVLNVFIFIVFFANGAGMLLAGQFLCGLSWGVFATLAPSYGKI
jgi:SP family general alpha glucoside:H+ symporter-like MFS transporter